VDKSEFVYSVNGLRNFESAGKALYRGRSNVGQKRRSQKKAGFCTLAPVDMQAFFHRRCDFPCFSSSLQRLTFGWRLLPASFLQTEKRLQEDSFEAGQDGRFAR
jgi:hypothetical protein